nr:MAG TPA: hypothetical protein [Bacteriophage sp.]
MKVFICVIFCKIKNTNYIFKKHQLKPTITPTYAKLCQLMPRY